MERKQNIEEIFENAKEPHPNRFASPISNRTSRNLFEIFSTSTEKVTFHTLLGWGI
jgi:hypothetical protein